MAQPEQKEANKYNPIILANANRKVRNGFEAAFASFMGPIKNAKDARREAERHFAYALAMESVAQTYANLTENELKAREDEINAAVRRQKHEIAKSPEFNAVCLKLDNGSFFRLSRKWEKNAEGKSVEKPVSVTEFKERYDTKVRELSKEVEEQKKRDRFHDLLGDLDRSTQKSFTGKLKSWFVGNSQEYKDAYAAMETLAYSPEITPYRKDQAKENIMKYLSLRGKKVRDHQYGRERFNAFMKGLAMAMEPKEFGDFCEQINASRNALDKNNKALVSAKDYMAPEAYQQLEQEQAKTEPTKTEPAKTETVKTGQEPQGMVL